MAKGAPVEVLTLLPRPACTTDTCAFRLTNIEIHSVLVNEPQELSRQVFIARTSQVCIHSKRDAPGAVLYGQNGINTFLQLGHTRDSRTP